MGWPLPGEKDGCIASWLVDFEVPRLVQDSEHFNHFRWELKVERSLIPPDQS